MDLECFFTAMMDTPDHIAVAEQLGYIRAGVGESPGKTADAWMTLGRAAERTSTIGLAVLVTSPRMHHVVSTAASIATLNTLAPGRVVVGVSRGSKGTTAYLGTAPAPWSEVEAFAADLRTLLAGDEIERNGKVMALCQSAPIGVVLPAPVPIWAAAHTADGYRHAARVGEEIVTNLASVSLAHLAEGKPVHVMYFGTVLDEGEDPSSDRVIEAAGPFAAVQLQYAHLPEDPAVIEYQRQTASIDPSRRHIDLLASHLIEVTELERPLITGDLIMRTTGSGTPAQIRERLAEMEEQGVTAVVYGPVGPDIPRELEAFANAVRG